jgi:large subunit ribosomal protein L28
MCGKALDAIPELYGCWNAERADAIRLRRRPSSWYNRILKDRGDSCLMAQVCDVCGRGPQFGNKISHAHNVTKRRWNINLQSVRALVNGASRRLRVCTSCIRSNKVQKAA